MRLGHITGRADVTAICTACIGQTAQLHHPFLWKNVVLEDLGVIEGDTAAAAFSINSKDQIVGESDQCVRVGPDGGCDYISGHAFLWENGSLIDLQTLIEGDSQITLDSPTNINDRAEIASLGILPNGDTHVVLLVPCTEGDNC